WAGVIAIKPPRVRLILCEQEFGSSLADKPALVVLAFFQLDRVVGNCPQFRPMCAIAPRPGIPKPDCRQKTQLRGFWPAIRDSDFDQNVFAGRLRIFDEDIEIPALTEDACVYELELSISSSSPPILVHELLVGKSSLGILVQVLHVGVRWS